MALNIFSIIAGNGDSQRKLGWKMRKMFFEQASAQIDNGLTLTTVIENFSARLTRRGRKADCAVFLKILGGVKNGSTLTEIMRVHLTDVEIGLLSAGESAGSVSQAMRFIVETKERERRIVAKIRSSMFSPLVYMVVGFAVLYFIGSSIVPQFSQIVPKEKWTRFAGLMRDMGEFATGYGMPVMIVVLIACFVLIWWSMPRWVSPTRTMLDRKVFPWTVYKEMQGFSWLTAFISMIRSGMVDVFALEGQIKTANPWLSNYLRPIRRSMTNGHNMFDALRTTGAGFPSDDLIEEIGAYVGFPDFPEKLSIILAAHVEEFEKRIAKIGGIVSAAFTGWMFGMFLVIQLGSNDLSALASASVSF